MCAASGVSSKPRARRLRRELGGEPTLADLAKRVGADESRLERTIVRINTIESTSPIAHAEGLDSASLPAVLVPCEPPAPDSLFEQSEVRDRVRAAMAKLPPRERHIVRLYYFAEATMKQIGEAIGVNESRVSQLHARAMQRLRSLMSGESTAPEVDRPKPARARLSNVSPQRVPDALPPLRGVRTNRCRRSAWHNGCGGYDLPIKPVFLSPSLRDLAA